MFYSLAHILVLFFFTFNFLPCLFPLPRYSSWLVSPACDYPPAFYSSCLPPSLCLVSPPSRLLTCLLLVNISSCVFKSLLVPFVGFASSFCEPRHKKKLLICLFQSLSLFFNFLLFFFYWFRTLPILVFTLLNLTKALPSPLICVCVLLLFF